MARRKRCRLTPETVKRFGIEKHANTLLLGLVTGDPMISDKAVLTKLNRYLIKHWKLCPSRYEWTVKDQLGPRGRRITVTIEERSAIDQLAEAAE
jgi:hypothetical protein